MAHLRIDERPDGAVVLTDAGGGRWGAAVAGVGAGGLALLAIATGDLGPLGSVVAVPFGLIALLAGVAAARHRDWIVLDRRAREIVFRRGLGAIFRPVGVFPFADVEAVLVEERPGAAAVVSLRREGDRVWVVDASPDPAYVGRLAAALAAVGGWPVVRDPQPAPS